MNVTQFLRIVAARWRIPAYAMLGCFALALGWVLFGPGRYTATANVLIDVRAPATVAINGDPGALPQMQPDYVATQVDVIGSNTVAGAAVDLLGLVRNPQAMDLYRAAGSRLDPRSWFAAQLLRDLRVTPSESSRVIAISFTENDAQLAAAYANAFAEAYRNVSVDLQRQPAQAANATYRANVERVQHQLAEAQAKLSARRAELGVVPNPDGTEAQDAKLVALSQQLALAQGTQAAMNQKGAGGALPDVIASPVVQSLQVEIARLESQRQQLAQIAGPNNLDYKQVVSQLASLRAQLAQQKALVAASAATTSGQASASVRQLEGAVAAERRKTLLNQAARGDLVELQENVANLKTTYEALTARAAQNALIGATDTSNVTILARAEAPEKQAGLPPPLIVVLASVLGFALGLAIAVVKELIDHRLRVPEDLPTWLGVPSLGGVRQPAIAGRRLLLGMPMRYLPGR